MAHIFIVGATGGVGSRLHPIMTGAGHSVTALHRKPEQAEALQKAGVTPVEGNIIDMDAEALAKAMSGVDAIVFSAGAAGAGKDKATKIDGDGPIKLIDAAGQAGVKRLYVVSVIPDAGRTADLGDGFEHYMAEKKRADVAVAASDLDWVLLRPGTLTDESGSGRVDLNRAVSYGDVSRDNVAAVLAELLETPAVRKEALELVDGDMSVRQAVSALERG